MASLPISIALVVLATLIGSCAPILLKKATLRLNRVAFSSIGAFLRATVGNKHLVMGILLYAAGFIVYLFALRGADLSILYPLNSLSYVWVSFLSVLMLRERMTRHKWAGVLLIVAGATLVGLGS